VFFVGTNIQFWITDYLTIVILAPKNEAFIAVILICITSPLCGATLSGFVANGIGGYKSSATIPTLILLMSIVCLLLLPIPLLNDYLSISIMLWFACFFGAIVAPIMNGVMITSVEPNLKTTANAIANFSYYLIGYFPAPFIYGHICENTGGEKSRWGLFVTFLMHIPALLLLIIV